MFNPITASQEIKDAFTDYITTTFDFADPDYADELKKSIQESGAVAKGPYLEVSGSYESGESIAELIAEHKVSPLFDTLENCAEKDKELKIQRGLYLHQIAALEKANARKNLVVTTGTGSGKTECFLIPIIDSLLKEEEAGTLNDAVRAIIIYPMNALANDQIKRLQKLLKDHPTSRFGLYNGNTEQTKDRALAEYQRVNGRNAHPLPNEVICRDEMQTNPPHILITNYSMLEYMMLRPKDDKVFSGAQLRYIVLDEAHIYKGATGMETSLLMRRLRARISTPGSVQYILTSATLGGYDLVQGCDCDTSCYKCLRNYYNQKIHDQLDRHIAANFIKPWLGVMKPIEEQQQEEATTAECERNSSLDTVLHTDCEYDEDSTSWNEIIENLPLTDSDAEWVSALQKIAERDFLPFPVQSAHITVERSNDELWPDMAWPNLKLALYTSDNTDAYDNWPNCDWKAYKIGDDTLTPEKFAEIIRNTTIR